MENTIERGRVVQILIELSFELVKQEFVDVHSAHGMRML